MLLLPITSQRAGLTSGPCALSGQSLASATTRVWFYLGTFETCFGSSGCVRRAREHRKPRRGNCVHRVWARIGELQAVGTSPDRVQRAPGCREHPRPCTAQLQHRTRLRWLSDFRGWDRERQKLPSWPLSFGFTFAFEGSCWGRASSQRKAGPLDAAFVAATPQASRSPPLAPALPAQTAGEIEPQLHFAFCSPFRETGRGGQRENLKGQAVIYD